MKLIIGLGNPGEKFQNTRHNVGFLMVDKIKEKYAFPDLEFNKKFNAEISKGTISNSEVLLVKPQTFMNLSGESVRAVLDFYKTSPDDIIVIHDDLDIPLGKYKIATESSSAGHNGVQDIIDKLGTKKFQRIRIGIKLASDSEDNFKIDAADFVLQKFSDEELEIINGEISKDILLEVEKLLLS
jgi:PTH1 family peptidyl-tRNA hydrolase